MKFSQTLRKYYDKRIFYGAANPHSIPAQKKYNYFIIIPAYAEKIYLECTLNSINKQEQKLLSQTLIVVIINNSKDDNQKIKDNNHKTYEHIIALHYNFEFILIDCFSSKYALPSKDAGVGLARKIGMDYCIKFSNENSLFCSIDADTLINKNYLQTIMQEFQYNQFGAAVINFKHQKNSNPKIQQAIIEYENLLKDIAKNIKRSGSPYGFVSMGSTIVCSMKAYVLIGGIPPKKATEDFYFLQKLAKYKPVYIIDKILVYPSSRAEERVYLGTGFRMKNIYNNIPFNDLYIKPQAYKDLNKLYQEVELKWNHKSTEIINIQKNITDKKQLLSQFHRWFDNLKIYKFLKLYGN